ncbi:MAG: hypothetical protein IKN24_00430 [Lachnospiraceae bacterium]|nr:hypothetical protein [Lachnospiraceae bacterium]
MNENVKELVDLMCKAAELTGTVNGLGDDLGIISRTELAMYMMYLSMSDGEISTSEAETISQVCGLELAPEELAYFVADNDILNPEFGKNVPVTLKILVKTDNDMKGMGNDDVKYSDYVLETYKAIGELVIGADKQVKDEETENFKNYIGMMEDYISNNLK